MHNENIGKIGCPFCGEDAHVRKNTKGKLYYYCPERCGIVQPALPAFQEWILNNATLFTPVDLEKTGSAAKKITTSTEDPAPVPDPAPEPKKRSFLDKLLTLDE